MCPLRFIIIFLSATLAGFLVIRNLKSQREHQQLDDDGLDSDNNNNDNSSLIQQSPTSFLTKVHLAMKTGFWTCVDMASGKYLWRHLVSSAKRSL